MTLCACTTTTAPYQKPQIEAALRVVGKPLPKLPNNATLADILENRIQSDEIHNTLMARFRGVLKAVGADAIEEEQ